MKKDGRRKITLEQRDELIRRRTAGEATVVLAADYGLSRKTVDEIYQQSLRPKAKLQRRQVYHYLELLGLPRVNVQTIAWSVMPTPTKVRTKTSKKAPSRKYLKPEVWVEIMRRFEKGESIESLGAEFGVSPFTIQTKQYMGKKAKMPLISMTMEHLEWLEKKLMPAGKPRKGKHWSPIAVREMLEEKFGARISLRTFRSHLKWMGVKTPSSRAIARREALKEAKLRIGREQENAILAAIRSGLIPEIKRGRRKKETKQD